MKQILQNLKNGIPLVADIPAPNVRPGHLLIATKASVISLGTEKMLLNFGQANFVNKVRQQPDKTRQVLEKIRSDGLRPTLEAVRHKLDQPLTLGYSNAGVVVQVGSEVEGFKVGDRVLSNGPHAELVAVPRNLCAKIPDGVPEEHACFGVVAAIGLQGVRLLSPTIGEKFVVTGLGLIGLLVAQILRANGCEVLGIDFDSRKCALAKSFGASVVDLSKDQDPISTARQFSQGHGVDGVVITASTKSNDPVHQAAKMCRKRGRIVLVGVVGLQLQRDDFYEKELTFQVSCSYGPGRYDSTYEKKGQDYPLSYVRWTVQRNFQAALELMARRAISVEMLISERYCISNATDAYRTVSKTDALGIVITYPDAETFFTSRATSQRLSGSNKGRSAERATIGAIGSGNFAGQVLFPCLKALGPRLKVIASNSGTTATHVGRKTGFELSSTDPSSIFHDSEINAVVVATRHDSHAGYVIQSIAAGKAVYVEKPLCLNLPELKAIKEAYTKAKQPIVMVGFNRRFSPLVVKAKELLAARSEPKAINYTINAGYIVDDHWTQNPKLGGGRLIGEACHFIDLCRHLIGARIRQYNVTTLHDSARKTSDTFTISLQFEDGSIASINYYSNGHTSIPKERVQVFCNGGILELDNFRLLTGHGWPRFRKLKVASQAKGHREALKAFLEMVETGAPDPIPFIEAVEVTQVSMELASIATNTEALTDAND